jgi:hypothetical protein
MASNALRSDSATTLVISGAGGMGKSQLTVEIVHRFGQYFEGGVFWLNLATAEAIPAEVASCGGPAFLNIRPDFSTLDRSDQIALVQQAWSEPMPRLLIFDGCADPSAFDRWLPKTGGCRVVLTTRWSPWPLPCTECMLEVLTESETIQLLTSYREDLDPDSATLIGERLGRLPLALSLAGGFMSTYRSTALGSGPAYLQQLGQVASPLKHPSMVGRGSLASPTDHSLWSCPDLADRFDCLT